MESRRVGGMRTRMEGGKEAGLHGGGCQKAEQRQLSSHFQSVGKTALPA